MTLFEGTVMNMEKTLISERSHVSKYAENFALQLIARSRN